MSAIGAAVKLLVDRFIDVAGLFTTAAGLAGLFAQLFPSLVIALGGFEHRLISARTWRILPAQSVRQQGFQFGVAGFQLFDFG